MLRVQPADGDGGHRACGNHRGQPLEADRRCVAGLGRRCEDGSLTAQPVHHPYASMNWFRFIGSLRCAGRRHQFLSPLSGLPR